MPRPDGTLPSPNDSSAQPGSRITTSCARLDHTPRQPRQYRITQDLRVEIPCRTLPARVASTQWHHGPQRPAYSRGGATHRCSVTTVQTVAVMEDSSIRPAGLQD